MPDLTEEIGLLESRIADLAKRLDSGESGESWKQARELYTQVMKSRADDDQRAMLAHLHELGAVLKAGNSDWQTWKEIEDLIMKKVQAVETQLNLRSETCD
jgi:hypothetical protein